MTARAERLNRISGVWHSLDALLAELAGGSTSDATTAEADLEAGKVDVAGYARRKAIVLAGDDRWDGRERRKANRP